MLCSINFDVDVSFTVYSYKHSYIDFIERRRAQEIQLDSIYKSSRVFVLKHNINHGIIRILS